MAYRSAPEPRVVALAARTNVGRRREVNEDCFAITLPGRTLMVGPPLDAVELEPIRAESAGISVLCGAYDGCGGVAPGDVASRMLAIAMHEAFEQGWQARQPSASNLARALANAGTRVFERASSDAQVRGMGATAVVAAIAGQRLMLAHVGDTRAYRLRGGRLEQLTTDDTLQVALLRAGKLTPEQAADFPHKNVVTRALGVVDEVEVSAISLELEGDERLLLCTDGLTSMVGDDEIARILQEAADVGTAGRRLIAAAEAAGGEDNETVVIAEVSLSPGQRV
jgi:PPM family protein phosphatase